MEIVGRWPGTGISGIEVVFKSPETNWSQVQGLVPFYGLRFGGWVCRIKEGEKVVSKLVVGDEWDVRLKGLYRKERKA